MSWGISSVSRLATMNRPSASASDPEWGRRNSSRRPRVARGFRRGSATQSLAKPPLCNREQTVGGSGLPAWGWWRACSQDGGQPQVIRGMAAAEPSQRPAFLRPGHQEHPGTGHDACFKPDRVGSLHRVGQPTVNDQVYGRGCGDQPTVLVMAGGRQVGSSPEQGITFGRLGSDRAQNISGTIADGVHGTQNIASSWRRTRPSSLARGGRR